MGVMTLLVNAGMAADPQYLRETARRARPHLSRRQDEIDRMKREMELVSRGIARDP
jgi:hypothetical protein